MTILVRDEEDILPQMLEFHKAQGVDHFIVTDNLSEDSTPEILEHYRSRGWLTLIKETEDNYDQQAWVTRMARMAAEPSFSSSWVIHSDADEFWLASGHTLKEYFSRIPEAVNIITAPRHDFVCLKGSSDSWYAAMVYRKAISLNARGQLLPPKVAHRPVRQATVAQGNHSVSGITNPVSESSGIEILHFPIRSRTQLENKISKGGAAYQRNSVQPPDVALGWRRLYQTLLLEGSLKEYFDTISYDEEELRLAMKTGELVFDDRVRKIISGMLISYMS